MRFAKRCPTHACHTTRAVNQPSSAFAEQLLNAWRKVSPIDAKVWPMCAQVGHSLPNVGQGRTNIGKHLGRACQHRALCIVAKRLVPAFLRGVAGAAGAHDADGLAHEAGSRRGRRTCEGKFKGSYGRVQPADRCSGSAQILGVKGNTRCMLEDQRRQAMAGSVAPRLRRKKLPTKPSTWSSEMMRL